MQMVLAAACSFVGCGSPRHPELVWSEQSDLLDNQLDESPEPSTTSSTATSESGPVAWEEDLAAARKRAKRESRLLLVWVHADWAVPSMRMKRELWSDAPVQRALQSVVTVMIDATGAGTDMDVRLDGLKVTRVPEVVVLGPDGTELGRTKGAATSDSLLKLLKSLPTK